MDGQRLSRVGIEDPSTPLRTAQDDGPYDVVILSEAKNLYIANQIPDGKGACDS